MVVILIVIINLFSKYLFFLLFPIYIYYDLINFPLFSQYLLFVHHSFKVHQNLSIPHLKYFKTIKNYSHFHMTSLFPIVDMMINIFIYL